jgi:glycosyltransferase involved in cell wall biosynthesis
MANSNTIKTLLNTAQLFWRWIILEVEGITPNKILAKTSSTKKVGLLSFRLPPQFDSGTHRPLSFLQYAEENQWDITAITNQPDKPVIDAGRELLGRVPDSALIINFEDIFGETSWRVTPKLDGGFANAISLALHAYKEFSKNRPSVILASGPPFSFCIAGLLVSRALNIPLVLDYRDEWTLCPFEFASKHWMDKWFEKRCVKQAKKIFYTTNTHLVSHKEHFGLSQEKLEVIYNGWEENSFPDSKVKSKNLESDKIKISFIGRLNEMVSVTPFLSTLSKAVECTPELTNKISVEFVGEKSPKLNEELMSFINRDLNFELTSTPLVNKTKALELMRNSDYLLMLCGQKIAGYIQGKLYDYLSRGVPVIAFGHPGEVPSIITELDAGHFIADGDIEGLANALLGEKIHLSHNLELQSWLAKRTRQYQAKNMFELLNILD